MGHVWLGKAMFINIILPFLLILFMELMDKKKVGKDTLILLVLLIYAAFCATATGLYLYPLSYAVYTLVFLCAIRNFKEALKLCIPVAAAMPYVIIKYIVLARTNIISIITEDASSLSYRAVFKEFIGSRYMVVVLAAALLILLIYGEKKQKYLFVLYPILGFVTYLNPFLHTVVAQYLTGADVYDRLFWLLQVSFVFIADVACVMYRLQGGKRWLTPFIILAGMLLSGCRLHYSNPNWQIKENMEGVTEATKQIADAIIEKNESNNRLLLPRPYVLEVRQYTGQIELVYTLYVKFVVPESIDIGYVERLDNLNNILYSGGKINSDIWDDFTYFNVKYVGVYPSTAEVFEGCPIIYEDADIIVYDIENRN